MEIKIFGKKLFSVNKGEQYISLASDPQNEINKSKYLPDFYKRRGDNFSQSWTSMGDISVATLEDVSS
ncbi:hypothetical protein KAR91_72420, partial [Candidatus Pacearchaeota archaeon]|nr:hypothetical protein [Candidatus Pacearchaeota archaeon]